jgi:hypothetical protein
LRRLLKAKTDLVNMSGGGNTMVSEWWCALSDEGRREYFPTLNMACRYVDLINGVSPWPSTNSFGWGPDEVGRLDRAMLDAHPRG